LAARILAIDLPRTSVNRINEFNPIYNKIISIETNPQIHFRIDEFVDLHVGVDLGALGKCRDPLRGSEGGVGEAEDNVDDLLHHVDALPFA